MVALTTYFEWTETLMQFAAGDDTALPEMQNGAMEIDAGTIYRFYAKVKEAYVARKKRWLDQFSRAGQVAGIRSENELAVMLQNAKGNLRPLAAFTQISAFPDDLRETLQEDFKEFIEDVRKNIKSSVQHDQPGNEKVLLLLNSFHFFESVQPAPTTVKNISGGAAVSRGRRIIL